jgi:hypothetical protein
MTSLVKQSKFEAVAVARISAVFVATMAVTYLVRRSARMVLCASVHEGSTPPRALSAFSDGMSLIFMGCAREEAPVPMLYANPMMSLTPRQVWHGAPSIGEDIHP